MFRITPKSFNAVNMVFASMGKGLAVVQAMVFAPAFGRIIASEFVSIMPRSFSRVCPDMLHQFVRCHAFHHLGVNSAVAFQKAENNAFPRGASSSFAFPPSSEIGLVYLNLAFQFSGFKFGHMVNRFTQALIDAAHGLVVLAQMGCDAVRRVLLITD